jgi:hypothetical protein
MCRRSDMLPSIDCRYIYKLCLKIILCIASEFLFLILNLLKHFSQSLEIIIHAIEVSHDSLNPELKLHVFNIN